MDSRFLNGAIFPNYHISIGTSTSALNQPRPFLDAYFILRGIIIKNGLLLNFINWSNRHLITVFLHTFHDEAWEGWIFEISLRNSTNNGIMFSRGGFQEACGNSFSGAFYVSIIFEEHNLTNEWLLDKSTHNSHLLFHAQRYDG